jgi:uncharacterized membrane protein YbhN (UPF0104 family)
VSRSRLASIARFAVCLLLLAVIFHVIFSNEVQLQLAADNGPQWDSLGKWEQRRLAWTQGPAGVWATVRRLDTLSLAVSSGCCGLLVALGGLRWREVLLARGIQLGMGPVLRISFVAHFFNAFLLGSAGGDVMKAWYAAKAAPERSAEAAFSVFVDRLLGMFALLLFTAVLMVPNFGLLAAYKRHLAAALVVLGMLAVSGAMIFVGFFTETLRHDGAVLRLVRRLPRGVSFAEALAGCRALAQHPGFLWRVAAWSLAANAAIVGAFAALARGLGVEISGVALWYLVPAIVSIAALPVTPAGLGVRENLFVWLLTVPALGVKPGVALSLSLLGYTANLLWSVVGGVVYLASPRSTRQEPAN